MLVRFSDIQLILEKIRDRVASEKFKNLLHTKKSRNSVSSHWDYKVNKDRTRKIPRVFWEHPYMERKIDSLYGNKNFINYIFDAHLKEKNGLRAASIGCGNGKNEISIATLGSETGTFSEIYGIDLSPASIEIAKSTAAEYNLDNICSFSVNSVEDAPFEPGSLDAIFCFSSLHHFSNLPSRVKDIAKWLKPGGLIFAHEYVGARRHQYSSHQISAIKTFFNLIPAEYRKDHHTGKVRKSIAFPGSLLMRLYDPSETIESDEIIPAFYDTFDVIDRVNEYGSLLFFALKDIIHNFDENDRKSIDILDSISAAEMNLINGSLVPTDFCLIVGRARA